MKKDHSKPQSRLPVRKTPLKPDDTGQLERGLAWE